MPLSKTPMAPQIPEPLMTAEEPGYDPPHLFNPSRANKWLEAIQDIQEEEELPQSKHLPRNLQPLVTTPLEVADFEVPQGHPSFPYAACVVDVYDEKHRDPFLIDCETAHFGFRAGDIIRFEGRAWFVEGYTFKGAIMSQTRKHSGTEDRPMGKVTMLIRQIGDKGEFQQLLDTAAARATLKKEWGTYDPETELGHADVAERPKVSLQADRIKTRSRERRFGRSTDWKRVVSQRDHLKQFETPEQSENPYTPEAGFSNLMLEVLKVELDDVVKRLHRIAPLEDPEALRARIKACETMEAVLELNEQIFDDMGELLDDAHDTEDIQALRAYVQEVRETQDTDEILTQLFDWIRHAVLCKTGFVCKTRIPETWKAEDAPTRFKAALNALIQEIAYYLNPNFAGKKTEKKGAEASFAGVYSARLAYFSILHWKYDNAQDAAKHVVGAALEATKNVIGTAGSHYFRPVVEAEPLSKTWDRMALTFKTLTSEERRNEIFEKADEIDALALSFDKNLSKLNEAFTFSAERTDNADAMMKRNADYQSHVLNLASSFRDAVRIRSTEIASLLFEVAQKDPRSAKAIDDYQEAQRELLGSIVPRVGNVLQKRCIKLAQEATAEFVKNPSQKTYASQEVNLGRSVGQKIRSDATSQLIYPLRVIQNKCAGFTKQYSHEKDKPWAFEKPILPKIMKDRGLPNRRGARKEGPSFDAMLMLGDPDIYTDPNQPVHLKSPIGAYADDGHYTHNNNAWIQLSVGCSHGKCHFCPAAKLGRKFRKPETPAVDQLWLINEHGTNDIHSMSGVERVYVGSENALAMDMDTWKKALESIKSYQGGWDERLFAQNPSRGYKVETYARPTDVLRKTVEELTELRKLGLTMVYIGLESGNNNALTLANKKFTKSQYLEAAERLRAAGIDFAVMVMPGLGGVKNQEAHIQETAEVIGETMPKFVSFFPVNYVTGDAYDQIIEADPENRHLTAKEMKPHVLALRDACTKALQNNPNYDWKALGYRTRIAAPNQMDAPFASKNPVPFNLVVDKKEGTIAA